MDNLNGLANVNIELTSRCNKKCFMCGRRKLERDYPSLTNWGDMDYEMVKSISSQLLPSIVVQLHDGGEPLMYPHFGEAVALFKRQIRCMDTNGRLLVASASGIIDNLDTITVSVFENDPEALEQWMIMREFMSIKGDRKPRVIARCLGKVNSSNYYAVADLVVTRTLHNPMGSFDYKKKVTIPEIGICLDALNHLAIKRDGKVSMCVRFDPEGLGTIGDLTRDSLSDIWGGKERKTRVALHIAGKRPEISLCNKCDYWGCPTG